MTKEQLERMDKAQLVELVQKLKQKKKFGLVWEDKPEDVAERCKKELPVLKEVKERAITKFEDGTANLIIEGDNYHALSVLNYTHAEKIDVIYIDPPYNTGARDWKYNNDYVDKNDTYRHSKWISMIHKRLLLAKMLLKSDGVMIVTIDDNELYHLGVLLEEIFPSYNQYIVTIEHNRRGRRGKNFAKTNEWAIFLVQAGIEAIQEEKSESKLGGETRNLRRTGSGSKRHERPKKFYPIWVNEETLEVVKAGDPVQKNADWKHRRDGKLITVWPIDKEGVEKNWHYGVVRTRKCIEEGQLEARRQDYGIQVYYTLREKDSKKWKTVWSKPELDASTYGSELLASILGNGSHFDYPKSLYAVIDCLKAACGHKENALILDFFAGSGTTGHAVLKLNEEDDGDRRFILCTNNENEIAEKVCYPRVKKVIEGYANIEGIPSNMRYFKTDFVSKSKISDDTRRALVKRSTEMICVRENAFEKITDKEPFKIFKNEKHSTGILFDLEKIEELKTELQKLGLKAHIYVFSLTNDTFDEDFSDLKIKHKLCPIPESILEVYRKLFKE